MTTTQFDLLETLGYHLCHTLFYKYTPITALHVWIKKPHVNVKPGPIDFLGIRTTYL